MGRPEWAVAKLFSRPEIRTARKTRCGVGVNKPTPDVSTRQHVTPRNFSSMLHRDLYASA